MILTLFYVVQVYKFAYAHKSFLGDPAFSLNMDNITAHLISPEFAAELVAKISDNTTFSNISEYGTSQFIPSASNGMTHISVIDSSELMVSATLWVPCCLFAVLPLFKKHLTVIFKCFLVFVLTSWEEETEYIVTTGNLKGKRRRSRRRRWAEGIRRNVCWILRTES